LGTPEYYENFASGSIDGSNVFTSGLGNTFQCSTGAAGTLPDGYADAGSVVTWTPGNISVVDGVLQMILTQSSAGASAGCEMVSTNNGPSSNGRFGYGSFEVLARAGSTCSTPFGAGTPVSGGVSAGFIIWYATPYTEIDIQQTEGIAARDTLNDWAAYSGTDTSPTSVTVTGGETAISPNPWNGYHYYGCTWSLNSILFFVDGVEVAHCSSTSVPSADAQWDINHWGTNISGFGGAATTGVTRYSYYKSLKYWT
jgi:beta-glucanase (GH16 family)